MKTIQLTAPAAIHETKFEEFKTLASQCMRAVREKESGTLPQIKSQGLLTIPKQGQERVIDPPAADATHRRTARLTANVTVQLVVNDGAQRPEVQVDIRL